MSTKTTTQNTNQYTTQGTQAQNTLSTTYTPMVQNPYSGLNYQMGLQANQGAANRLSANNLSNSMSNYNMSGMGNLTGGARASLLSGLSRSASSNRMTGFMNNWNTATGNQQFGANVLGNLSGQLSGTTSTTTKSGTGTWLTPLLTAATGGLFGLFSGGLGGGGGDSGGGAGAGIIANNQWANAQPTTGSYGFGNLVPPSPSPSAVGMAPGAIQVQ